MDELISARGSVTNGMPVSTGVEPVSTGMLASISGMVKHFTQYVGVNNILLGAACIGAVVIVRTKMVTKDDDDVHLKRMPKDLKNVDDLLNKMSKDDSKDDSDDNILTIVIDKNKKEDKDFVSEKPKGTYMIRQPSL